MGISSMTGFGRGESSAEGVMVEVEVSSVNRKQFDLHMNLPRNLVALESKIHALVHSRVKRGHVKGLVRLSLSGAAQEGRVSVDSELAEAYLLRLREVAGELSLSDDFSVRDLLCLPDVVSLQSLEADSASVWPMVEVAVGDALDGLLSMRNREGTILQKELVQRFEKLQDSFAVIRSRAPEVPKYYEQVLRKRLERIETPLPDNDPTFQRELALFVDRCDISEEIARLDSHFTQVAEMIESDEPCGRPLDFLCQEMFREINTIGSKANDADISRSVITFKSELEAVREQVQNIE